MCGILLPPWFSSTAQVALPFGVTLLAPAWWDEWLWGIGARLAEAARRGCGPEGHGVAEPVRIRTA